MFNVLKGKTSHSWSVDNSWMAAHSGPEVGLGLDATIATKPIVVGCRKYQLEISCSRIYALSDSFSAVFCSALLGDAADNHR
jgi:hypothetical protein